MWPPLRRKTQALHVAGWVSFSQVESDLKDDVCQHARAQFERIFLVVIFWFISQPLLGPLDIEAVRDKIGFGIVTAPGPQSRVQ